MIQKTKKAMLTHWNDGLAWLSFFAKIQAEGGKTMQKFIARLIDCGFPRLTAVTICRHFRRLNRMKELAEYVYAVEIETRTMTEDTYDV